MDDKLKEALDVFAAEAVRMARERWHGPVRRITGNTTDFDNLLPSIRSTLVFNAGMDLAQIALTRQEEEK